jgi:hypothetical protein
LFDYVKRGKYGRLAKRSLELRVMRSSVRLNGDVYYPTAMSLVTSGGDVGLGAFSHLLNGQKSSIAPSSLPCMFRVLDANSRIKRDG